MQDVKNFLKNELKTHFSPEEIDVLEFADEIARNRTVSDRYYQAIVDRFGTPWMINCDKPM